MALVVKDRVQEITGTTGTGTITLGGAVLGYQSFATVGNGNTTYYTIVDLTAGDWEVGIGTYTASGTTLSRDTVLSSSNAGSLVPFGSGTKNVFVTYPSERSVYLDSPGSYPVQSTFDTLTAATATLTAGTITTPPSSGTDIVNKDYADSIASGLNYHQPVNYASVAALPSYVYSNGTLGVGATITASANGALSFGGGTPTTTQRLLVKDEAGANQPYNGVYTVTNTGSPTSKFVLTRATDYDTSGTGTNEIDAGDYILVLSGTNASTAWVQQTPLPIVVGTTALVFLQFNAPITYNAGTGLNLSPATTFNISDTGVSAATYGSASQVPVMAINAQGQVTSATNTAIAIAAGAVSGLAASATTDTTNASNITSGTLGTSRLSGSYTGITGVGTLTAGTWNGSTVGAGYGGTGFSSYAVGDLLYADTTSTLDKLADVAVGNALISGGVGAAPSWGKIGLATAVSGTLPIANGGTGTTSTTFVNLGTNVTGTLPAANGGTGLSAVGTTGNVLTSNGTAWVSSAPASTMVYPGSGIPNSTGSSWGTSYSTSGSGTVVALATSPSLTTPTIGSAGATFSGSTSGTTVFKAAAIAGTTTITMPGTTGTMALTSDINNGTLSMGVSGTGLSGSATFTANQSGASTFTVTSNATNANTASTIVARDASGNFSAGTITASLTGTASNTSAVANFSVNQYNTQNLRLYSATTGAVGLLGVDSAGTFKYQLYGSGSDYGFLNAAWAGWDLQKTVNGQLLLTVSGTQYTTLHSGNYNSYAPTLTGTGASGTWGISISGNAATATTATNLSGGSVSATTGSFQSLTLTGSGYVFAATPAVTTAVYGQFGNSTSTTRIGLEGSVAGNTVSGSLAYNSYVGSVQSRGLHLITNNTVQATVDASGNFLLGTTTSPAGSKELVLAGDYIEGVVAIGNSGTAQTLSLANGTVQTVTMTGNCTFTMPGLVAGKSFILIASTGSGSFTASFTSVKWPNNTAPTLTTTASRWDIFTFVCNGSAWYGNSAQAYA